MKILKQIVTLLLFVLMGWYLLHLDDCEKIKNITVMNFSLLFFLYFVFYFFISPPIKKIANDLGHKIPLWDVLGISLLTNLLNYVLPVRGGIVLRGFYLKKKYGLGLKKYAALSLLISLVGLVVTGFSNGISFLMNDDLSIKLKSMHSLAFLVLGCGAVLVMFSPNILMKISKKVRELNTVVDWNKVSSPENIGVTFVCYSLALAFYVFRFSLLCDSLDISLPLNELVSLVTLSLVVNLLPLLPGNVGVKEASFAGVFHLLGYNYEIGALVSIIDRFMQVGFLFLGSLIFSLKTDVLKLLQESKDERTS